jgi:hypothetical protein
MFSITSSLVSGRSCKSSDLIPGFVKLYPVLLPFHLYTQIRDEIGTKDRVTLQICLNVWQRVTMWTKIVVRYVQNFLGAFTIVDQHCTSKWCGRPWCKALWECDHQIIDRLFAFNTKEALQQNYVFLRAGCLWLMSVVQVNFVVWTISM